MADELKMAKARAVYETICAAIEHRNWTYDKDSEKLLVHLSVNGEDIPIELAIFVEAEKELVTLLSPVPFKMSDNKRVEGAIAACVASYAMADGSFDYDIQNGGIVYRMVAGYKGSTLGEGVIHYLMSCACAMVDRYNDRFLALEKDMISIQEFINME